MGVGEVQLETETVTVLSLFLSCSSGECCHRKKEKIIWRHFKNISRGVFHFFVPFFSFILEIFRFYSLTVCCNIE